MVSIPDGYILLAEAFNRLGRKVYGDAWDGTELDSGADAAASARRREIQARILDWRGTPLEAFLLDYESSPLFGVNVGLGGQKFPVLRPFQLDPQAETDWRESQFTWQFVGPSRIHYQSSTIVVRDNISLDQSPDVDAEKAPIAVRGRKTQAKTKQQAILKAFDEMVQNGEVSFAHGGQSAAAQILATRFRYKPNSVTKIIHPTYKDRKTEFMANRTPKP